MLMHFATLLAAQLLTPAPTHAPADLPLADALPGTAIAAVHIAAPQVLVSKRATNDYVGLMLDPRMVGMFAGVLELAGGEEEEANAAVEWCNGVLQASDELLLYADLSTLEDATAMPCGLLVARGGDDLAGLLRATLGTSRTTQELSDGTEVTTGGDRESMALCQLEGAHVLAFSGEPDEVMLALERLRAARSGEDPCGLFQAEGIARHRSAEADLAFGLDLSSLWKLIFDDTDDALQAWILEGCRSIRWAHGTFTFGDAEAVDLDLAMPYEQGSFVDELLERAVEVDRARLRDVPASAGRLDAVAIDVAGLLAWLESDVSELDPSVAEGIDQAFTAAREFVGIDLREAIIENVADTIVTWESAEAESTAPLLMPVATTYVLHFADIDPLIDLMDVVQGLAAGFASVSTGSHLPEGSEDEYELWNFDSDLGELRVAVGAGRFVISAREDLESVLDLWATTGPDAPARLVDDPRIAAALARLGSIRGGLTIQDAGAAGKVIRTMGGALSALGVTSTTGVEAAELQAQIESFASVVEGYLDGVYVATMQVTADRVIVRGRSR